MKLFALCCLLILGLLACLPTPGAASPSRDSGSRPGSGSRSGNPFHPPPPQQRPFYYDAPVRRQPSNTMYA
ncbi:immune-induced peptide 18 [Drosophila suzukii]|uniref:Immune-induced peptide 18 n=1 Tax=Drosophila suzukii TaxID=28584 RepID=A0AB39Z479_DROSZ|nr:immune-induced peptide 18 [Drosophila suzukii]